MSDFEEKEEEEEAEYDSEEEEHYKQYLKEKKENFKQYLKDRNFRYFFRYCNNLEIIKELVENNEVDVNTRNIFGENILALSNNSEVIEYMIQKKANVNAAASSGNTPIYYQKDLKICEILLKNGANPNNLYSCAYNRPLLSSGYEKTKLLIHYKADIYYLDRNNYTYLHEFWPWNSDSDNLKKAQLLIDSKCNINAVNKFGLTPLFTALELRRPEYAKLLIKNKADINIKWNGKSVVDFIKERKYFELLDLIK